MEPRSATLHVVAEHTTGYGDRLAFAPDGARWVSARAGAAQLWRADAAGAAMIAEVIAESSVTGHVRFSRDGARLLLAPFAYDLARGAWIAQASLADKLGPPGGEPGLYIAAASDWAADGADLVVAASSRRGDGPRERVIVLRGDERAVIDTPYEGDHEIRSVAIDDAFIAFAGRDVAIWSRAAHRQVATLPGHAVTVTELAFSPDGRRLGSLDGAGVLLVWDTARWGAPIARIQTSTRSALALAFHPALPLVATGGYDGVVRLWDLDAPAAPVFTAPALGGWIQGLAFDPRGDRLLAAANASPARIVTYQLTR